MVSASTMKRSERQTYSTMDQLETKRDIFVNFYRNSESFFFFQSFADTKLLTETLVKCWIKTCSFLNKKKKKKKKTSEFMFKFTYSIL